MKPTICDKELEVLREIRSGSLSEALRQHLATCTSCSEAVQVDRLLAADARRLPDLEELPDPTLVLWRARQQARLRNTERATLPIQVAERLAMALGALGLVIGLSLTWPIVRAGIGAWLGGWTRGISQALPLEGLSLTLALACSLFFLVGFGLYTQWAEG